MRNQIVIGFAYGVGFLLAGVVLFTVANLLRNFGTQGRRIM